MTSRGSIKLTVIVLLIAAAGAGLTGCSRSKGETNTNGASTAAATIEVSTTPAILRQMPRFFEATGSLAPNVQTDVAPENSGKVAAVRSDDQTIEISSLVRKRRIEGVYYGFIV